MGLLVPVSLPYMRSLNWAVNLQAQYAIPDKAFYNPWKISRRSFPVEQDNKNWTVVTTNAGGESSEPESDYSREYIYSVIEAVLHRYSSPQSI